MEIIMEKICIVYVPVSSLIEAEEISMIIVKEKLAACANIIDAVTSFYVWEKKPTSSDESVLLIKTREGLLEKLEKRIVELHSYDTPCIMAIPALRVNAEYYDWVMEKTSNQ